MGLLPTSLAPGKNRMPRTDVSQQSIIWIVIRRDVTDQADDIVASATSIIDNLHSLQKETEGDPPLLQEALDRLEKLKAAESGYAHYHIQGVATTEEIAISMCRDETYLIGPLPVNAALAHARAEWPGLYFPLKDK